MEELSPHTKQVYSILKNLFGKDLTIGKEDSADALESLTHAIAVILRTRMPHAADDDVIMGYASERLEFYLHEERAAALSNARWQNIVRPLAPKDAFR